MKKITKIAFLLLSIGIVFLTSCKVGDQDETPVTPPTNTEKITEKNFYFSDLDYSIDGTTAFSYSDLDDCEKDDFTRFEKDGTALDDEGVTKCDAADPQTDPFTWLFLANETELQLNFGMGDLQVYSILTNDGTTLKLRITETEDATGDGNDNTIVATLTFTAR